MFDWLLENRTGFLLLFAAAAIVCAIAWWRTRRRNYLFGLGGIAALAGVYFLLTLLAGETDAQQIERKIREMAAGVEARQLDRSFAHVSDRFRRGQAGKAEFRRTAESLVGSGGITEVVVWDLKVEEVSRENRTARATFHTKAKGPRVGGESPPCRVHMEFVLDPDGQWRMNTFQVFFLGTNDPAPIPG